MASDATSALQEQEARDHSAESECGEEEEEMATSEESSSAQPSTGSEPAHRMHRMLSSASAPAAAWHPPSLDDSLWAEDDDDEGLSGWTPWTPASFKMAEEEDSTSAAPMTTPVGTSQ